jgi:hypothetical protein
MGHPHFLETQRQIPEAFPIFLQKDILSGQRLFRCVVVPAQNTGCSALVFWNEARRRGPTRVTPEDRDQMIDLCKRIARESDPKKLASWIEELNEIIQSKIRELREARRRAS